VHLRLHLLVTETMNEVGIHGEYEGNKLFRKADVLTLLSVIPTSFISLEAIVFNMHNSTCSYILYNSTCNLVLIYPSKYHSLYSVLVNSQH
jgi:hypothetical protein